MGRPLPSNQFYGRMAVVCSLRRKKMALNYETVVSLAMERQAFRCHWHQFQWYLHWRQVWNLHREDENARKQMNRNRRHALSPSGTGVPMPMGIELTG